MDLPANSGTFGLIVEIVDLLISLSSIILNVIVAHILVKRLRLTQSDTVVSFIICIIDFIFSSFSIINLAVVWASHYQILHTSALYCQINGLLYSFLASSVADAIMILAILRYLAICCNRIYSIKLWVIISTLFICFNLACCVTAFSNLSYIRFPSLKYCTYNPELAFAVIVWYIFGIKESVALLVIIFCYLRIAHHYANYIYEIRKDSNKLISQFHPKDTMEASRNTTNSQLILDYGEAELKVKSSIKKIYIIIAIYAIEFLGFLGIQSAYKILQRLPDPALDNIISLLSHLIPLTNPLFVLFFHDETNHELQSIFYLMGYRFMKKFGL